MTDEYIEAYLLRVAGELSMHGVDKISFKTDYYKDHTNHQIDCHIGNTELIISENQKNIYTKNLTKIPYYRRTVFFLVVEWLRGLLK